MIPNRYNVNTFKQALSNPSMFLGEYSRLTPIINAKIQNAIRSRPRMDVMQEDWDVLYILDGCRFDIYDDEVNRHIESRFSPGAESREFMEACFCNRTLHDTVYITANPHTPSKIGDNVFHDIVPLYEAGWDEELETIPPEVVTDALISASEEYPHKRLIAHYMQPHFPFIGPKGRSLDQVGLPEGSFAESSPDSDQSVRNVWRNLQYRIDDVSRDLVIEAYRENLELVLESVDRALSEVSGKAVITADHGNLIGEWTWPIPSRGYGHDKDAHLDGILKVPWDVRDSESRREIRSDPPESSRDVNGEYQDQLRALGYV